MGDKTAIEWADASWNPIRGCSRVSEGCRNCYAERIAARFTAPGQAYHGVAKVTSFKPYAGRWTGEVRFIQEALDLPLRWKRPRRIFVNSMSDLFHERVEEEWLDRIFAVMALTPRHTYQILTKRPERMAAYLSDPETPGRVARAADRLAVAREILAMGPEEIRPILSFPGYFISDRGRVLSASGSAQCLYCGKPVEGIATKAYCDKKCRQNAQYHRRTGRLEREGERVPAEMSPDAGDEGHLRVTLYRDGVPLRELVHRLVLTTFVRPPQNGEQGCHRNGDAANNALPNLRWGTQSDNWEDRKRHGHQRSYAKLTPALVADIRRMMRMNTPASTIAATFGISDTQARNIHEGRQWVEDSFEWPLPSVWAGTSVEDQATADERIPLLLQTPAAVRFVSYEPALGPVDFGLGRWVRLPRTVRSEIPFANLWATPGVYLAESNPHGALSVRSTGGTLLGIKPDEFEPLPLLSWVICGGESGPGARGSDIRWFSSARDQCRAAGVAFFMKQFGASPYADKDTSTPDCGGPTLPTSIYLRDRKGGDMAEFPEDLRVREFPA